MIGLEAMNGIGGQILLYVLQFGLAILFALVLNVTIQKTTNLIGDKTQYGIMFPLLIPTTVLIILIIKSSLALSLGLVGALSIIRFRTPIKDPEELVYIFIAISLGLGIGAGKMLLTSLSFVIVIVTMVIIGSLRKKERYLPGVFVDIESQGKTTKKKLADYTAVFKAQQFAFDLRRYEESAGKVSATYYVETKEMDGLEKLLDGIRAANKDLSITVVNCQQSI